MIISCGLIITYKNKILLGHVNNKTFWDIPKGQLEDNETYLECCLREVKEEMGLDLHYAKRNFVDLGLFNYSKDKSLYLFKYECNKFFDLRKLKCTSYYEKNNIKYPEIDYFKYIDFSEIYKYTNGKLGFLLSKILNIPLNYDQKEQIRRTMCYILRHKLPLNNNQISTWLDREILYDKCIEVNPILAIFSLDYFLDVIENDKNSRFSIDKNLIKANYGHTQEVNFDIKESFIPKNKLYHLTFSNFMNNILEDGLKPMNRHYVFLATTMKKAQDYKKKLNKIQNVNKDYSITPVLLEIDAIQAYNDGITFFQQDDPTIICTNHIPSKYIKKTETLSLGKKEYDLMIKIFNQS